MGGDEQPHAHRPAAQQRDYIIAVSPLGVDLGFYSDPMALIIVVDPEARRPKADDLSAYFGLSLAECRLAVQLMSGKPLGAIAAESGASMATLRSQLRSILKKIKVERQADLFLVLASVPSSLDGDVRVEAKPPPTAGH
jgi:DNA-binding CsgD family transcriptional regulator